MAAALNLIVVALVMVDALLIAWALNTALFGRRG